MINIKILKSCIIISEGLLTQATKRLTLKQIQKGLNAFELMERFLTSFVPTDEQKQTM